MSLLLVLGTCTLIFLSSHDYLVLVLAISYTGDKGICTREGGGMLNASPSPFWYWIMV